MRKVLFIMGHLSDGDVEWLAQNGRKRRLAPGTVAIEQGRSISALYILLEGTMAVNIKGLGEVARLSTGEVVGEMSMIDSRPPSASVIAVEPATVLELDRGLLQSKLESDIGFAARFYKAIAVFLSDRLRGTVKRMGYGQDTKMDDDVELDGELDEGLLDTVNLAGLRFEQMLKKLLSARD